MEYLHSLIDLAERLLDLAVRTNLDHLDKVDAAFSRVAGEIQDTVEDLFPTDEELDEEMDEVIEERESDDYVYVVSFR